MKRTFSYEEVKQLIESEPAYPTMWPEGTEERWRDMGVSYQVAVQSAVELTKKALLERLSKQVNNGTT